MSCQCSPGYYRLSATSPCQECGYGYVCPGADQSLQRLPCGTGLSTLIKISSREDQCVTLPGYGFISTTQWPSASVCPIGTFSSGKTRNPCRACGNGLTTNFTGTGSMADCVAPAGYYLDKSAAKPCPRGTYIPANNRLQFCTPCANGVTTPLTGTTSASLCNLAKPGFYMSDAFAATKCPRNFYQPVISATTSCTPCPASLVTLALASTSRTACLAPAGFEFINQVAGARPCTYGWYKMGINRRTCVACGQGFNTTGLAKTSFSDCYIARGWGTIKVNGTWVAVLCGAGAYGATADTFGVRNLPCTPCPAGMTSPVGSSSPNDCVTLPGWGYNSASQTATLCDVGSWSPGGDKDECVECGEGFSCPAGSDAPTDCVIAPGWGFTDPNSDPEICPKGYYGLGGLDQPCTLCPPHFTTSKANMATEVADCDLCEGGYGDTSCAICPPNAYSPGDSAVCSACPPTYQSPPGTITADDCLPRWTPVTDMIEFSTSDARFVSMDPAATDPATCQASCDAASSCMFFAWNATSSTCFRASEVPDGPARLGFKSASEVYTVYAWDTAIAIGTPLSNPGVDGAAPLEQCADACDEHEECLAVLFVTGTCRLLGGTLDADVTAFKYKSEGARMDLWLLPT